MCAPPDDESYMTAFGSPKSLVLPQQEKTRSGGHLSRGWEWICGKEPRRQHEEDPRHTLERVKFVYSFEQTQANTRH